MQFLSKCQVNFTFIPRLTLYLYFLSTFNLYLRSALHLYCKPALHLYFRLILYLYSQPALHLYSRSTYSLPKVFSVTWVDILYFQTLTCSYCSRYAKFLFLTGNLRNFLLQRKTADLTACRTFLIYNPELFTSAK